MIFTKIKRVAKAGVCEFLAERLGFFGGDIGRGHYSLLAIGSLIFSNAVFKEGS